MQIIMSTLKDRVMEAVIKAKQNGYDVNSIAKKCGKSVQAVHAWTNPSIPIKTELKAASLCGLSVLSGLSPFYINDGTLKQFSFGENNTSVNEFKVTEPALSKYIDGYEEILSMLSELDSDDIEIFKSDLKSAVLRTRKKNREKSDREMAAKALDPPLEEKRTA